MKVLLTKDVPNLGKSGNIRIVKDGYARNYLLPNSLVIPFNANSSKHKQFLEEMSLKKIAKRRREAEEYQGKVEGVTVTFQVKVGEGGKLFGSITSLHIHRELKNQGIAIDRRDINLDSPIRSLGIFSVSTKLFDDIAASIKVVVQDEHGNTSFVPPKPETENDDSLDEYRTENVQENTSSSQHDEKSSDEHDEQSSDEHDESSEHIDT